MTAFKQVVGKLQQANPQEALIGLEFVLRLDPDYAPALNLRQQLSSGAEEINLDEIVAHLNAPTTDAINNLLVEAVEEFNDRNFDAARAKVEQVLLDLPGHQEARQLLRQIDESTKDDIQVRKYLSQARAALAAGDSQEAANFVMMAQALDPHHSGIAETISEIELSAASPPHAAGDPADGPADAPSFNAEDSDAIDFSGAAAPSDVFSEPTPEELQMPDLAEIAGIEASFRSDDPPEVASEGEAARPESFYTDAADDVSDLFQEGPGAFEEAADSDDDDQSSRIRHLLARGGAAAAADDYAAAIDAWSRILLIEPTHEEAHDRIEHIRHAKEELDRRIEPMLADAQEALEGGDETLARSFIDRILVLAPNHFEASVLADRIGPAPSTAPTPEAAPEAAPEMPELEDELFKEEFAAPLDLSPEVEQSPAVLDEEWRSSKQQKARLPWQKWAAIGATGAVIIGLSLWAGSSLLPKKAPQESRAHLVNRVLIEAAEMAENGRIEEAIVHLEANSADDDSQVRIDKRLSEYRQRVAPRAPTAIPEGLAACRSLIEEGRWIAAYERVEDELKRHPNDPGLEGIRTQILETEPTAATIYRAAAAGDYRAVVAIARDLLELRPEDPEVADIYERSLFNAGISELRAFNLPESERFFAELRERQPQDEEVRRLLEFVNTYKSRPVDMQLQIFVSGIPLR